MNWDQVLVILICMAFGFYFQRRQIDKLQRQLDDFCDALREEMDAGFAMVNMHFSRIIRR